MTADADADRPVDRITHGWADTSSGRLHYVEVGVGQPVLFLHQTPMSWLEFAQVLPLAGRWCRAIALDSVGFGDSERPPDAELTIDHLSGAVVAFLDSIDVPRVSVVGHHTGGIVALNVAALHPDRVDRLVLSSTPLIDQAWRDRVGSEPRIDVAAPAIDGSHVASLWAGRQPFYPADRVDLLEAFIVDALRAQWPPSEGHRAVQTFRMEDVVDRVQAPALLIASSDDPFVVDDVPLLAAALQAEMVTVPGGMIPLPNQFPDEFDAIVRSFLQPAQP